MKRWDSRNHREIENTNIDEFLSKIIEISKEYGLSISHEDTHGAFIIDKFNESDIDWLMDAMDGTQTRI